MFREKWVYKILNPDYPNDITKSNVTLGRAGEFLVYIKGAHVKKDAKALLELNGFLVRDKIFIPYSNFFLVYTSVKDARSFTNLHNLVEANRSIFKSWELNQIGFFNRVPNDPEVTSSNGLLWHLKLTNDRSDIDAPLAWEFLATLSADTTIANLDSGVAHTLPDLQNNIVLIDSGFDIGHGTHVQSTMAAEGNNGSTGAGLAGVIWEGDVEVYRIDTNHVPDITKTISSLDSARVSGTAVVNLSASFGSGSPGLETAISNLRSDGIALIVAAGNSNEDLGGFTLYPQTYSSTYDNIMLVGAIDIDGGRSSFSNFGEDDVHIAAPGSDITVYSTTGSVINVDGTSFAAPIVTATYALIKDFHDEDYESVFNRIFNSSKLETFSNGPPGAADFMYGTLSAGRAISYFGKYPQSTLGWKNTGWIGHASGGSYWIFDVVATSHEPRFYLDLNWAWVWQSTPYTGSNTNTDSSFWFYHSTFGWIYTNIDQWPKFWQNNSGHWLQYYESNSSLGNIYCYDFTTQKFGWLTPNDGVP